MDLHHLKHFVAVAEELNFGRAARKVGIVQPALSQSIKRLEDSLGVRLFDRNREKVLLTPAGRAFLPEARRTLLSAEVAEQVARRAATGEVTNLRVGLVRDALMGVFPEALRVFLQQHPDVHVQVEHRTTEQQYAELHAARLDIGFLHSQLSDPTLNPDLTIRTIERSPFIAAVPSEWKIARKQGIKLSELAGHPFVISSYWASPQIHSAMIAACQAAGFVPRVAAEENHIFPILTAVACGKGVALIRATASGIRVNGVRYMEVTDLPEQLHLDTSLAWVTRTASPTLHAFVATIEEALKSRASLKPDAGTRPARPSAGARSAARHANNRDSSA